MTATRARRVLVPDSEIKRILKLAQEQGIAIAGLDVGSDYVRVTSPTSGENSVEGYIGPTHRPKKAGNR